MKKLIFYINAVVLAGALFTSCVEKDFDEPENFVLPVGEEVSLKYITQKLIESKNGLYKFSTDADTSFYGTIVMDDKSGNIYKQAYLSSEGVGIRLECSSSGLYVGDSVRINLNGLEAFNDNNTYILRKNDGQGFDINKNLVKIQSGLPVLPKEMTVAEAIAASPVGTLIKLTNVQFNENELTKTYGDTIGTKGTSIILEDINDSKKTVTVRTSAFANFANLPVNPGKGSVTGVYTKYGSTSQLVIREKEEIELEGNRPIAFFVEGFDDDLGDFSAFSVVGDNAWKFGSYKTNTYAQMTGGVGGSNARDNEDWLVSKQFDLTDKKDVKLTFRHASNFVKGAFDQMTLWVSTDWDGASLPSENGTWKKLSIDNFSDGNSWTWVDSGDIDLSEYDGNSKVYIAFKYISTPTLSPYWEVDNIKLYATK